MTSSKTRSRGSRNQSKIGDWTHWKPSQQIWCKGWWASSERQAARFGARVGEEGGARQKRLGDTPRLEPMAAGSQTGSDGPTTLTTLDPHNDTNEGENDLYSMHVRRWDHRAMEFTIYNYNKLSSNSTTSHPRSNFSALRLQDMIVRRSVRLLRAIAQRRFTL
ncbi:hypothetical protein BKA70DRAFT_838224 [Coprinopsis sp. MPI-PUGE-AT-0042]|nr:hypothetical protein BKA70DRAFT_838224 [Coprinopsis sp. MPI-PUGE-AT-0042]